MTSRTALVAVLMGCVACTKQPDPPRFDATNAAIEKVVAAARTLRVVALAGHNEVEISVTSDGHLLLADLRSVEELRPDGTFDPIGSPEALAPLAPAGPFAGYEVPRPVSISVAGSRDLLAVRVSAMGRQRFVLRGGKLEPRQLANPDGWISDAATVWQGGLLDGDFKWIVPPSDNRPAPKAPDDWRPQWLTTLANGTLVGLRSGGDYFVWSASTPGSDVAVRNIPNRGGWMQCALIPAFDGHAYAQCRIEGTLEIVQLDGASPERRWPKVRIGTANSSVGSDGALYASGEDYRSLQRCPTDGPCETLAIDPQVEADEARPLYVRMFSNVARDGSGDDIFQNFSITNPNFDPPLSIRQIVARSRDDVWVLAGLGTGTALLHSQSKRPPAARWLPSFEGVHIAAMNDRPPQAWIGHCDAIFVRLGPAVDAPKWRARADELRRLLDFAPPLHWSLVTGQLYRDDVVGVVIGRDDPAASLEKMEEKTQQLIARLADNPVTPPSAFCTLPILARLLTQSTDLAQ